MLQMTGPSGVCTETMAALASPGRVGAWSATVPSSSTPSGFGAGSIVRPAMRNSGAAVRQKMITALRNDGVVLLSMAHAASLAHAVSVGADGKIENWALGCSVAPYGGSLARPRRTHESKAGQTTLMLLCASSGQGWLGSKVIWTGAGTAEFVRIAVRVPSVEADIGGGPFGQRLSYLPVPGTSNLRANTPAAPGGVGVFAGSGLSWRGTGVGVAIVTIDGCGRRVGWW
jgi:hypothetical protein